MATVKKGVKKAQGGYQIKREQQAKKEYESGKTPKVSKTFVEGRVADYMTASADTSGYAKGKTDFPSKRTYEDRRSGKSWDKYGKIDRKGVEQILRKNKTGGVTKAKDGKWIQKAVKTMRTDKPCTGPKFGSKTCPPGSKRYNLAKTFKKMSKKK